MLWLMLGLIPILAAVALVIRAGSPASHVRTGTVDIRVNGADADALNWPEGAGMLMALFIALPLAILILRHLKAMLDSFVANDPFRAENGDHLRAIGFALIGLQFVTAIQYCVALVLRLVAHLPMSDIKINLELNSDTLTFWFVIAMLFVLAAVFREGARLRDEQALTV
jgi:hypothetical protein